MTKPYKELLISNADIAKRIDEMAAEIIKRYKGKNPLFVCLLRGGAPFATRLMFAISRLDPNFQPELDYMTVKTYGDEREGRPSKLIMDVAPITDVSGRHIILLDDVLDKGFTASFAHEHFINTHDAVGVDLVVLVQKKRERTIYQNASLYGFEGPDVWLTGMGMDDARIGKEANRWLDFIGTAKD